MDIICFVLQLAILQGLGTEVRHRDSFLFQDCPRTFRPVTHQFFGTGVHRTGDQVENQLPLCLQCPQTLQTFQQDLRVVHVLAEECSAALHVLPGFQQQRNGIIGREHLPREGNAGSADISYLLTKLIVNDGFVSKHQDLAELVQSVTPCPTADLVDLRRAERAEILLETGNSKTGRIRRLIRSTTGKITKTELMAQCPDISQVTVQRALNELQKTGEIVKLGGGRYTAYKWNWEEKQP